MKRLSALILACLVIASPAWAEDETFDLGPRWTEGQAATYRATTNRTTVQQVKGAGIDAPEASSTTLFVSDMSWKVTKVNDDGSAEAEMLVTDLSITITTPQGEEMKVDRKSVPDGLEPLQKLVKGIIGKPLTVQVDPTGHVTGVKGFKAIKNAAGEAGDSLTERDFRETASELAVIMGGPADAKPGKTWKESPEWDHELGTLEYASVYSFQGVEAIAEVPIAIVNEQSKLKLNVDKAKLPQGGPQITIKVREGSRSSQVMFDLSRHEVVGAYSEQILKLDRVVTYQGRSITVQSDQQTTTQLIRLSEE